MGPWQSSSPGILSDNALATHAKRPRLLKLFGKLLAGTQTLDEEVVEKIAGADHRIAHEGIGDRIAFAPWDNEALRPECGQVLRDVCLGQAHGQLTPAQYLAQRFTMSPPKVVRPAS